MLINTRRTWSDLPTELYKKIGKLLGAVCSPTGRSSIAPDQKTQVFPPIVYIKNHHVTLTFTLKADIFFYSLKTPPSVHMDGDSQISERDNSFVKVTKGGTPQLLTGQTFVPVPEDLDISEYGATELARVYSLYTSSDIALRDCKVAMSSSNADCAEIMFLAKDTSANVDCGLEAGLYHCKLSKNMDNKCYFCCTKVTYSSRFVSLEDIIFHQGKFYGVDSDCQALVFDSSSTSVGIEIAAPRINCFHRCVYRGIRMHLFESPLGEINVVITQASSSDDRFFFMVLKLEPSSQYWSSKFTNHWSDMCESNFYYYIDDQILFLGDDFCFSVYSQDRPEESAVFRFPKLDGSKGESISDREGPLLGLYQGD